MRVLAINISNFQIHEFNNVTSISWNSNTVTIVGQKIGDTSSNSYALLNSEYLVRIIAN